MVKVFVLAGFSGSLVNFRKDLLIRMVTNGHEVVACGPEDNYTEELKSFGVRFIQVKFDRLGMKPHKDLAFIFRLARVMRREKPDVYFGYTIKPVIFGSIAAMLARVKNRYAMITGLGSVFIAGDGKKKYIRSVVELLYKIGLKCTKKVFFQNKDDCNEFLEMKLVNEKKCLIVNGSGVNLDYFSPMPMPDENIFLFAGSVMGDKGIREYMNAASIVKQCKPDARCWIVGAMDKRLTGITEGEMKKYLDEKCIEYFGFTREIKSFMNKCRYYVLPSYREGTPRSVLEAMATGRPIITTDAPGCRETVTDTVNGFLVPVRNSEILAQKMLWLIEHPAEAEKMGQESIRIVREKYDVNKINHFMLSEMSLEN